jgi:hypothetical protein
MRTLPSVRDPDQTNWDGSTLAKQPDPGAKRRARIYPPDLLIECPVSTL